MALHRRPLLLMVYALALCYAIVILAALRRKALLEKAKNGSKVKRSDKTKARVFRPAGGDAFVFWHVQRTGGTAFNGHLVNLDVSPRCVCSTDPPTEGACRCATESGRIWLYSRLTTSSSCGVHPTLKDLKDCAPKFISAAEDSNEETSKRYYFITVFRETVRRYLSEWHHLQATPPWPTRCQHVQNPVETCLKASNSTALQLTDFIRCPGNPANNRIVRMLIMDEEHLCDELDPERSLAAARKALRSLHFIGITDDVANTRRLFEATFSVKFTDAFTQSNKTQAENILHGLNPGLLELIQKANSLDIELYAYAKTLFREKLHDLKL